MKLCSTLSVLGLLTSTAYSHYMFSVFIVNGTETPEWKYVRDVAPEAGFTGNFSKMRPQMDINSEAMACGRQADLSAGTTQTADVVAGSEVGFHISHEFDDTTFNSIFHNGPAQAYLARVPNDDFAGFKGTTADWFKIAGLYAAHDTTPNPDDWVTFWKSSVNFTIPLRTPPGKYLLRIEQFMGSNSPESQWYVNCAHINIIGAGGGEIPKDYAYAKFPGTYKAGDPLIFLDYHNIWNKPGALLNYTHGPGPDILTFEEKKETVGVRFAA